MTADSRLLATLRQGYPPRAAQEPGWASRQYKRPADMWVETTAEALLVKLWLALCIFQGVSCPCSEYQVGQPLPGLGIGVEGLGGKRG